MSINAQLRRDHATSGVSLSALRLLESARHGLARARRDSSVANRHAAAHLAALRAAAAVVTARTNPGTAATYSLQPQSLWELLPSVEPTLSDWATHFAAGSRERAAAEAGLNRPVSHREADDLVRDAQTFVALVEEALGVRDSATDKAPGPTVQTRARVLRELYRRLRNGEWRDRQHPTRSSG